MPVSKISAVGDRSSNAGAWTVDLPALLRLHRLALVDRLAQHVEDPAERLLADRHADRRARVDDVEAAGQSVGRVHRDRAHLVVAEVLLHLRHQRGAVGHRDLERVVDRGQIALEHRVDDDAPDRDDLPEILPVSVRHVTPLWLREDACFRRKQAGFYQAGRPSGAGLRDTRSAEPVSQQFDLRRGVRRAAEGPQRRSCTVDCWSRGSTLAIRTRRAAARAATARGRPTRRHRRRPPAPAPRRRPATASGRGEPAARRARPGAASATARAPAHCAACAASAARSPRTPGTVRTSAGAARGRRAPARRPRRPRTRRRQRAPGRRRSGFVQRIGHHQALII